MTFCFHFNNKKKLLLIWEINLSNLKLVQYYGPFHIFQCLILFRAIQDVSKCHQAHHVLLQVWSPSHKAYITFISSLAVFHVFSYKGLCRRNKTFTQAVKDHNALLDVPYL